MTIDEAIKTYTSNAEYERTHGNLQGCLDFRQLAEWLKDYKQQTEVLDKIRAEIEEIEKKYGLDKAIKYGNENAEQQRLSYSTMMMYEVADLVDDIKEIIDKYKAGKRG